MLKLPEKLFVQALGGRGGVSMSKQTFSANGRRVGPEMAYKPIAQA